MTAQREALTRALEAMRAAMYTQTYERTSSRSCATCGHQEEIGVHDTGCKVANAITAAEQTLALPEVDAAGEERASIVAMAKSRLANSQSFKERYEEADPGLAMRCDAEVAELRDLINAIERGEHRRSGE